MGKKEKQNTLVSHKFLPIFETLLKENKAQAATELTIAILRYDIDGTEPSFSDDSVTLVWLSVIKPYMDDNKKAYEEVSQKRRNAVNQRYENSSQENTNATNEYKCSNSSQENTNATDNDYDVDVDNDCDREKENDYVAKEKPGGGFSDDALEVSKLWEQRFGLVSSYRMQNIQDLVDEYGADIAAYAIKEAHQAGKSSWQYIKAVARNEHMRRQNEDREAAKTGYAYPRGKPAGNRKNDAQAGRSEALSILGLDGDGSG